MIIKRKCVVCGKLLKIHVNSKGEYTSGHYFGKMKLPYGNGENKKIESTNILGEKIDVVKWTGKEKEFEYWECDNCYKEGQKEL